MFKSDRSRAPSVIASSFPSSSHPGSAIAASAQAHGGNVTLRRTNETSCADLIAADAIALGSPVYWGGLSAQAKSFPARRKSSVEHLILHNESAVCCTQLRLGSSLSLTGALRSPRQDDIQTDCFGWPMSQMQNKVGAAFATGGHEADGKDAAMATVLNAWRAMEMVTVSCANGTQRLTRCSAWGAAATHPPQGGGGAAGNATTNRNATLTPEERGGAAALGARLVEVARLMRAATRTV